MAIEYVNQTFDAYAEYLESVKPQLPVAVYSFAADPSRHDLTSPTSLHDSWLKSLEVTETSHTSGDGESGVEVRVKLLGPQHDRDYMIRYIGVVSYELQGASGALGSTEHGDLLRHEIKVAESGALIHDIEFSGGSEFHVVFTKFDFSEEIHT